MDLEERAIQLIDRIYEAAIEPDRWQDFVEALSDSLGGSYVAFGLFAAEDPSAGRAFLVGITPEYRKSFLRQLIQGLPFAAHFGPQSGKRFFELGEFFPEIELTETEFYRDWMAPQKLAPCWPVGCSIYTDGKQPAGWCYLCQPAGFAPLGDRDFALLDLLLPHLERALRIHLTLSSTRSERRALGEVIDRLPTGVLLVDAQRRVVSTNASADAILAQDDGFKVCGEGGPAFAHNPRDNEAFKRALAGVLEADPDEGVRASGFTTISRKSGARSYVVMVTPLLDALPGSSSGDAVAAIFIADPEAGRVSATQVLETVYQLTHAEAELVRLLSEGCSLEEAAAKRGVTINTARGQLKQVFAKTDTKRQPELVRLVLTGVGTLRGT
jgi:DNA-binding CsgD family transcriptional regulator